MCRARTEPDGAILEDFLEEVSAIVAAKREARHRGMVTKNSLRNNSGNDLEAEEAGSGETRVGFLCWDKQPRIGTTQ